MRCAQHLGAHAHAAAGVRRCMRMPAGPACAPGTAVLPPAASGMRPPCGARRGRAAAARSSEPRPADANGAAHSVCSWALHCSGAGGPASSTIGSEFDPVMLLKLVAASSSCFCITPMGCAAATAARARGAAGGASAARRRRRRVGRARAPLRGAVGCCSSSGAAGSDLARQPVIPVYFLYIHAPWLAPPAACPD